MMYGNQRVYIECYVASKSGGRPALSKMSLRMPRPGGERNFMRTVDPDPQFWRDVSLIIYVYAHIDYHSVLLGPYNFGHVSYTQRNWGEFVARRQELSVPNVSAKFEADSSIGSAIHSCIYIGLYI